MTSVVQNIDAEREKMYREHDQKCMMYEDWLGQLSRRAFLAEREKERQKVGLTDSFRFVSIRFGLNPISIDSSAHNGLQTLLTWLGSV